MEDTIYVTTRAFAPAFENDVELRCVRFYEAVTNENIVLTVWAFIPEAGERSGNLWVSSKFAGFEHAIDVWTTMRSRRKLQQYTYRPAAKDHGTPRFSRLSPADHMKNLKQLGLLIESRDHPFFKKTTDSE
jgi:hypothetical protein